MSLSDRAKRAPRRPSNLPRSRPLLLVLVAALCLALGSVAILRSCAGEPPGTTSSGTVLPDVKAEGAILVEAQSGAVIWSKAPRPSPAAGVLHQDHDGAHRARTCARPEEVRHGAPIPLPQTVGIGLRPDERTTIEQALRALIIKSANDAALTLAAIVAGDEPAFVRLMNARAQQLGLRRTHFENCRGTPRPGHLSSARDLAALGRFAMRDARFRQLAGTRTAVITWPPDHSVQVKSHNRLLLYPWGNGVKTGATKQSGMVLVGSGRPGLVPTVIGRAGYGGDGVHVGMVSLVAAGAAPASPSPSSSPSAGP